MPWLLVGRHLQKPKSQFELRSFRLLQVFFFNSINQSTWWVTIEKATVMSFNFQTKGRPDNWTATTRLLDRFEISEAWPVTWTSGIGSYCSQSWTGRWEDSDLPSLHQAVRHRLPLSWLGYLINLHPWLIASWLNSLVDPSHFAKWGSNRFRKMILPLNWYSSGDWVSGSTTV